LTHRINFVEFAFVASPRLRIRTESHVEVVKHFFTRPGYDFTAQDFEFDECIDGSPFDTMPLRRLWNHCRYAPSQGERPNKVYQSIILLSRPTVDFVVFRPRRR
jgi:hypothetical protein